MPETQPNKKMRWIVVGALLLVTVSAIAAMVIIPPEPAAIRPATTPPGLPGFSASTTAQTPTPTTAPRAQPTITPVTDPSTINEFNRGLAAGLEAPGQPWEYNPATNKHYDPRQGHAHWHDGPAPTLGPDGNPIALNALPLVNGPDGKPVPWYYDAATNRHWDPRTGHEHWHNGPVPNPLPGN